MSEVSVRNRALIRVRPGPLVAPVLSRVVGMLAARARCPIDRLDDALLIADAVAAHAPAFTLDGQLGVVVEASDGALDLRVGPLQPDGGAGLLRSAELPGVGNVLERVADEVHVDGAGDGSDEHLVIRLAFGT